MKKGQLTRDMILDKAAALLNVRGYFTASMSEIMEVTGLEKGGIYNHFGSKEQLVLEAFDRAVQIVSARLRSKLEAETSAKGKLRAVVHYFRELPHDPPIPGGCPLLNSAIESDDGHAGL